MKVLILSLIAASLALFAVDHPTATTENRPRITEAPTEFYFTSKRTGSSEIYHFKNGVETQLTKSRSNNRTPRVSPDGTKLLFDSQRDGNYELYVINLDGSNERNITNAASSDELGASWGNDSNTVIFESDRDGDFDVYMMNLSSSYVTQLTNHPADDFRGVLSPDGTQLVFTSERDGPGNEELYSVEFAKAVTDTSTPHKRLTNSRKRDSWASFSRDGSKILFHSERSGRSEIWEMNADGTNQRQLTRFEGDGFFPCYVENQNGRGILYASEYTNHNDWDILFLPLDAANAKPVKVINSQSRDYRPFFFQQPGQ